MKRPVNVLLVTAWIMSSAPTANAAQITVEWQGSGTLHTSNPPACIHFVPLVKNGCTLSETKWVGQFGDITKYGQCFNPDANTYACVFAGSCTTLTVKATYNCPDQQATQPPANQAPTDSDGDGIPDSSDNCPDVANADQLDTDTHGKGDACDPDDDADGLGDDEEVSMGTNPLVGDSDGDGMHDGVEIMSGPYSTSVGPFGFLPPPSPTKKDTDGDGIDDWQEVMVHHSNPHSTDTDGDGVADGQEIASGSSLFQQDNPALSLILQALLFSEPDTDGDGWDNDEDNCPPVANPDQQDTDKDQLADACDNCPYVDNNEQEPLLIQKIVLGNGQSYTVNLPQQDLDGDGKGDACDEDKDGDTFKDGSDKCPFVPNPDQFDGDLDGVGDACDDCPGLSNPSLNNFTKMQSDVDNDGSGDECDPDIDGDALPNAADNCPKKSNPDQKDGDTDAVGNACDNCPTVANPQQEDMDKDAAGNVCDKDIDMDGIKNPQDNCPFHKNPNQAQVCPIGDKATAWNPDGTMKIVTAGTSALPVPKQTDVSPAAKDSKLPQASTLPQTAQSGPLDIDKDGIPDTKDNCPKQSNANQLDRDKDTVGNVCDNCVFIANTSQQDQNHNKIGDVCEPKATSHDGRK